MRYITIFLLAFASFVSTTDLKIDKTRLIETLKENRAGISNRALEGILNDLIELIRNIMINGSENIPILDPIRIDPIEVGESIFGTPGSYVNVSETRIENLSTFIFDTLNIGTEGIVFQRYILSFETHIPGINIDSSSYDMSFRILGGDVFGTGEMNIKVIKPRIKGRLVTSLRIDNGVFLTINDCEIAVSLGDFRPVITGLWHNEVVSAFISRFFGNLVPELMAYFEFEINQIVSISVKIVLNEILKNFNLVDLIRP